MSEKPLAYASLKTVIQYLEPNLRFQLSLRIPSIRNIEKLVPLKINKLEFRQHEITVNDVTYKLGVYRDYHNPNEILAKHLEDNEEGGVSQDLDEYGLIDKSSKKIIESGDFVVADNSWDFDDRMNDVTVETVARQLNVFKWLRARRRGEDVKPDMIEKNRLDYHLIEYYKDRPIECIQECIDDQTAALQPYFARRDQIPPPYTKLVQFTYGNKIYRKKTEQKLWQLQKQLTRQIFGQRKGAIQVEQLNIDDRYMIVRLPSDMRIKLRSLYTDANATSVFPSLENLVDNVEKCLEKAEITRWRDTWTHFPIIRNAQFLVVNRNRNSIHNSLELLQTMSNQRVDFVKSLLTSEEYVRLVELWKETRRSVGFCYTFGSHLVEVATETYELLMNMENAKDVEDKCITIPISNATSIMYSYILTPNENEYEEQCRMMFEIVPVQ